MADESLQSTTWAYQIEGNVLFLYKINDVDSAYDEPDLDVTDGLKIEYITGDKVFVDSSGFSEDSSPSESSYLNARDSVVYAIIEFIKGKLEEDKALATDNPDKKALHQRNAEFYYKKFKEKYYQAVNAMHTKPHVAVPRYPYAIR